MSEFWEEEVKDQRQEMRKQVLRWSLLFVTGGALAAALLLTFVPWSSVSKGTYVRDNEALFRSLPAPPHTRVTQEISAPYFG